MLQTLCHNNIVPPTAPSPCTLVMTQKWTSLLSHHKLVSYELDNSIANMLRDTETQKDRQTDTQTDRETETERERDIDIYLVILQVRLLTSTC